MSAPRRSPSALRPPAPKFSVSRRGLVFCAVGALGIVVQLGALAALTDLAGMHYLLATALAVEAAILHNFLWHERWTWSDRTVRGKSARWTRLWRFNAANGGISMVGNLVVMQILVGTAKLPHLVANAIAIALCAVLNFLASDRWVFTQMPRASVSDGFPSMQDAGGKPRAVQENKGGVLGLDSCGFVAANSLRSCSVSDATDSALPLNTDARISRPNSVSSSNGAIR